MKIVIPGGSGHIGQLLARGFVDRGAEVVVVGRGSSSQAKDQNNGSLRFCSWDGRNQGDWSQHVDGADLVINLAGRSVNCRYNAENRKIITESRVHSAQAVAAAIAAAKNPPAVWMQMSTATLYEHRFDQPNDEYTGIIGGADPKVPDTWKFSIDVVKAWEKVVDEADLPGTRKVKMRTSILMSPDPGGPFEVLLRLVRLGLGGTCGSGKQYISWMHDQDFWRSVLFVLENKDLDGAINFAAPNPLPNAQFMAALRKAWGAGIGLPSTEWMLELGALVLQSETELILKSRRVVPARLLEHGFKFDFPEWPQAASDLCERWRKLQSG
ncbi:MAG: TIGR01777 family oxidoreductase [Cyanobacteria bacterium]|nr:TIGR01777 family oxidoreductase [Cyanobacteriota bacterium]